MLIQEAIKNAKARGEWSVVGYLPTTVNLWYLDPEGEETETLMDIEGEDPEAQLEIIWEVLHARLDVGEDAVVKVEAYGHISDQ